MTTHPALRFLFLLQSCADSLSLPAQCQLLTLSDNHFLVVVAALQPHVNRQVDETRTRLTEQQRLERQQQAARTMQLMVHACSCQSANCGSSSCRKVRALFQHSVMCPLKITGGCNMCKKMWLLLTMHAKSCTDPECPVPRCK